MDDLFGGVRESLILLPKKNGKSTLLGALALYHLCSTPDAECVIAAASRDQAQIMLRQAQGFIRRSSALQERVQVKQRELVHKRYGGRVRILASDVDTADGVIPTLALVDELHRHKSADLYGVFRDGLGPRDGRMVTISTAGDDDFGPLGQLRRSAYELPGLVRDGTYRYVKSPDGGFCMHEWALEPDADVDDMQVVKKANPASWQTVEELRKRHDSPSMTPWQWKRFACGIWLVGDGESAISPEEWRACVRTGEPDCGEWVLGVDLGWKWDCTALVPVGVEGGLRHVGRPTILEPPRDGTALDVELILRELRGLVAEYGIRRVVLDPHAGGEQLAQTLESTDGLEVVAHPQDPSPMATASERLASLVRERLLSHPDDPVLNRHVLAAVPKTVGGERWRLVKSRKLRLPVDGAVALAMAVSVLHDGHVDSVYEERGLLAVG